MVIQVKALWAILYVQNLSLLAFSLDFYSRSNVLKKISNNWYFKINPVYFREFAVYIVTYLSYFTMIFPAIFQDSLTVSTTDDDPLLNNRNKLFNISFTPKYVR